MDAQYVYDLHIALPVWALFVVIGMFLGFIVLMLAILARLEK